ncbi:hypothetical protein PAMP_024989 [Pampus punctatissimus]
MQSHRATCVPVALELQCLLYSLAVLSASATLIQTGVYAEDCCDPCLLELQNNLPKYYGTWSSPDSPNDLYLKLEDVTRRFVKPCIMDVKLGQRSYDPFASQEKREQQIRKYPLMEEIGFLLLGMRRKS